MKQPCSIKIDVLKLFQGSTVSTKTWENSAEKQYKHTCLVVHKDNYRKLCKQTTELAFTKKCKYYTDKIDNCQNNKSLFSVINTFWQIHFIKKIDIRSKFHVPPSIISTIYVGNKLSSFQWVTADEIYQMVLSFQVKCSPEDPIPADLLKKNIDLFVLSGLN